MITILKHGRLSKLILAIILLLAGSVFGQTRQEYAVSDFRGGLNLATDSIDQAPNEAIQADNTTLDKFGALHKRYGIINWNSSLISSGKLWNIHYVEDKNADKMLFFASNLSIYERKGWEDTVDVTGTQWRRMQVSYSRGIIDTAENGQRYIYGDSTSWILAVDVDDNIEFEGDIAQSWNIDSVLADTILHIDADLTSAHGDTTTYRIIKNIANPTLAKPGYADLSSWGGKLYVADGSHEPWYYDGDQPYLLGIVDSGTVTTAAVVDTTFAPYDSGTVTLIVGSNIVRISGGNVADTAFEPGNMFRAQYEVEDCQHSSNKMARFNARIIGRSTADSSFYLSGAVSWSWAECVPQTIHITMPQPDGEELVRTWKIEARYIRITTKQYQYLEDTTKVFPDGPEVNYVGFWIVNGKDAKKRGYISGNTDRVISFDSTGVSFSAGDRYYVVRQHPEMRHPIVDWGYSPYPDPFGDDPYPLVPEGSTYTELNYFKQIIFHRNRLYAIGYSIVPKAAGGFSVGDTINTGRIWFSDIAMPRYIFADWNFDVTGANTGSQNLSLYSADACQRMFVLRDDLYIITNSNIYRLSGEPDVNQDGYGLYLSQVVRGIGTNQPYGIVVTKDNVAYIMNQEGIWLFDGNVINKISYNVDPLVERYRGSRMVAGKFKDNLFFSYPDSNKTLLFFDPLKKFVGPWDIGMLTINDQFVAIDSNYFLFSRSVNSSYVLKYPRDFINFSDILAPNDTAVVVFRYRPGWLTLGTLRDKVLEDIEITAFTINPVDGYDFLNYLALYRDFTDTVRWSATAFSEGTPINAFESIGDDGAIHGRAYQILVKDSTDNDFWLSNYLLRWYDPTR